MLVDVECRKCIHCDELIPEDEIDESDAGYECGSCGETFTKNNVGSHKCPSCSRFASRLPGWVCPQCDEVTEEIKTITGYRCGVCGELFEDDDHECEGDDRLS